MHCKAAETSDKSLILYWIPLTKEAFSDSVVKIAFTTESVLFLQKKDCEFMIFVV